MNTVINKIKEFTNTDTESDVNSNSSSNNNSDEIQTKNDETDADSDAFSDETDADADTDTDAEENMQQRSIITEQQMSYDESIVRYMELKHDYEISTKKMNSRNKKKKNTKMKPQCVSCRRYVGTVFAYNNNIYSAACGAASSNNPCELDIRIKRTKVSKVKDIISKQREEYEGIKNEILQLKLDYLFKFMNETDMVNTFDALKLKLKTLKKTLNDIETKQNRILSDKSTSSHIARESVKQSLDVINNLVNNYYSVSRDQEKNDIVKDIVMEYVDNLMPKIKNWRISAYNIYEIERFTDKNQTNSIVVKHNEYKLEENVYSTDNEQIVNIGEVISFRL